MIETRRGGDPDPLDQFIWDPRYVDSPVVRFHDADTDGISYLDAEDNILYYTSDANWNVTALVDAATGNVVERYMYHAYGKVTILDGTTGGQTDWATDADQLSDVANAVLFAGYRFDSETGLYATETRIYHPTLGSWLGRDAGYIDTPNLYQYCRSNPAGLTDPSGLCGETAPEPDDAEYEMPGFPEIPSYDELVRRLICFIDFLIDMQRFLAEYVEICKAQQFDRPVIRRQILVCKPEDWISNVTKLKAGLLLLQGGWDVVVANTPQDAAQVIKAILGDNDVIDVLIFEGHGYSGHGVLDITAASFKEKGDGPFAFLKDHTTTDSLILFNSCNSFTGLNGTALAQGVSGAMDCRVGGRVGLWFSDPFVPIDTDLCYREVGPGGTDWPSQKMSTTEGLLQVDLRWLENLYKQANDTATAVSAGDISTVAYQPVKLLKNWWKAMENVGEVVGGPLFGPA